MRMQTNGEIVQKKSTNKKRAKQEILLEKERKEVTKSMLKSKSKKYGKKYK